MVPRPPVSACFSANGTVRYLLKLPGKIKCKDRGDGFLEDRTPVPVNKRPSLQYKALILEAVVGGHQGYSTVGDEEKG